jgi:DNA repair protein RadD
MMILREYQEEAVDSIYEYWDNERGNNPLVCAPTGSGKSVIIAEFCKRTCSDWKDVRIAVVTDSRELIDQNEKEMRKHWSDASTGIYSAGLNKKQTQAQILFVGIQSIYNKAFDLGKVDIILVDEAHMIPRKSQTRYGKFLKDMKVANPNIVVVGFTATPYRLDSGVLHEGEDAIFDGISYVVEMKKLIKQKYLVPVISKGGVRKIDLSNVHLQAGDYKANELAHAADDPELVKLAVNEIVRYGEHRKAWLLFASGVLHAEHIATAIRGHNISCEIVTGETPSKERDEIVTRFKEGKLRCLVNVAVFTKGFNAPICDLIALLMATKSTGKYVQIVGRGMRTHKDKEDTLLLDYGGNVIEHGPIDEVDPIKKKNVFCVEKKATPMKECPQCNAIVHTRTTECPSCRYAFPSIAAHGTEAYDGAVLASQQQPFFVEVKDVWYSRHKKPGKPDILKIGLFDSMEKEYPIWCCLEHTGYAQEKARSVVKTFGGSTSNVTDALKESPHWKKPIRIQVKAKGKFYEVLGVEFAKREATQNIFE